jgi:uncharacterized protein RhaS with RHS repeats
VKRPTPASLGAYDARPIRSLTQEDPIGLAGGLNLYGFAQGDPVNFSDPFGLCPICIIAVGYAIFEAASTAYDAYQTAKTLADRNASFGDKAWAVGGALSGFGLPGPGTLYTRAVRPVVPAVKNSKLANIVRDLYRGATGSNPIGTGSTADAIRWERITGEPVGGTFHTEKGQQYLKALESWLANNANAANRDRLVAQSVLDDLRSALAAR